VPIKLPVMMKTGWRGAGENADGDWIGKVAKMDYGLRQNGQLVLLGSPNQYICEVYIEFRKYGVWIPACAGMTNIG